MTQQQEEEEKMKVTQVMMHPCGVGVGGVQSQLPHKSHVHISNCLLIHFSEISFLLFVLTLIHQTVTCSPSLLMFLERLTKSELLLSQDGEGTFTPPTEAHWSPCFAVTT